MTTQISFVEAQSRFSSWLKADSFARGAVSQIINVLSATTRILIVGGAIRDCLLADGRRAKDIDIVIEGATIELIAEKIGGASRNFFGGLTFTIGGRDVDIWQLQDTYHIKKFDLPATIENFLAGAPLNLDKIAFDVKKLALFDDGCLRGLNERTISYAPRHPYLEHIHAVRAVLLRRKINFALDESIRSLFRRVTPLLQADGQPLIEIRNFLSQAHNIKNPADQQDILAEIIAA